MIVFDHKPTNKGYRSVQQQQAQQPAQVQMTPEQHQMYVKMAPAEQQQFIAQLAATQLSAPHSSMIMDRSGATTAVLSSGVMSMQPVAGHVALAPYPELLMTHRRESCCSVSYKQDFTTQQDRSNVLFMLETNFGESGFYKYPKDKLYFGPNSEGQQPIAEYGYEVFYYCVSKSTKT